MIFRNPKNGEVYDLTVKDCNRSGFCANISSCLECGILEYTKGKTCREFVITDPYKAAELMGYDVVMAMSPTVEMCDKGIIDNKQTDGKLRPSLVPPAAVWNVAAVREWAVANKYHDPEGWRKVPEEQYRDAMFRHMLQEWEKPGSVDKESGLPHLWHMMTNAFFIAQLRSDKHE